ncbi:SYM1 [Acrasis kona]|uniref:SYM1 n=1 Tax=Acrasis kona TaxID=1008807 RepID=A0AAW2YIY5_9EUKA
MRRLLASYSRALNNSPNTTKAITAGTLAAIGDAFSQGLEAYSGKRDHYDYMRTLKFSSYGFIIVGPMLHQWYKVLNSLKAPLKLETLSRYNFSEARKTQIVEGTRVAKQVFIDQAFFAPASLVLFFAYINVVEGLSVDDLKKKLEKDMWPTLVANWKLWPAVQFVNFALVPLAYRVLVVNFVSILWNAYLSYVQYGK